MSGELLDPNRSQVIISTDGSYLPSGERLTGSVDSVDKLETLIGWAHERRGLLRGARPRVWVIGAAVRPLAGSVEQDPEALCEGLGQALARLVNRGWELAGTGAGAYRLARGTGPARVDVEVLAEPQPWLAGGDPGVAEDAEELGRRLSRWAQAVGVLPEGGAWESAASLYDAIVAGKAGRITRPSAGDLPEGAPLGGFTAAEWVNDGPLLEQSFDAAHELVWLEQRSGTLASAGMLNLGFGAPTRFDGTKAGSALRADKRPFGLWLVTLPPGRDTGLPDTLPLPHPLMRWDQPAQVWLTSEDLTGLGAAVRDGGAGLNLDELEVGAALVWPRQGRVLEAWATRIREAMRTVDSPVLSGLLESAAAAYLDGLNDPGHQPAARPSTTTPANSPGAFTRRDADDEVEVDHYQPVWAAAIAAHVRFRSRRAAMRIRREHKLWPLLVRDSGLLYPVGVDEDTGEVVDLADTHSRLGRLEAVARTTVTDEIMLAILGSTESPGQLAAVLTATLGVDPAAAVVAREPVSAVAVSVSEPGLGEGAGLDDGAGPQAARVAEAESAAVSPPPEEKKQGERAPDVRGPRRKAKAAAQLGGVAAAVLDTDGLWLPDGTMVELAEPVSHVGDVVQLAWKHSLGFRLSERSSELGQIWLTERVCRAVGIDVDAISRRDRNKSLRELTSGLPFVELAAAAGYEFGGGDKPGKEGGDKPRKAALGVWTRVYLRDNPELKGPFVVLIPGIDRGSPTDRFLPILDDDSLADAAPAVVARRLQLFADTMRMPYRVTNAVTGLDLMLATRPRTHTFEKWRDEVFAPSNTKEPYGMPDVEEDFYWSRVPTEKESAMRYLHAYDRGGSYMAAIPGLELPIGNPVHHPDGAEFDPKLPGYWRIEVPDQHDWLMPYILNPKCLQIGEPKWVCTPRLERAIALGYSPRIIEAYVWPEHGRPLRNWYERFLNVADELDVADPDAQAVRNQTKKVRNTAIGMMGSTLNREGKFGYSPERRYHIISKASSSIIYRVNQIGVDTGRWPVAVVKDTVYYTSNDPDPVSAWPGEQRVLGRGFGQYKPERSGLLAEQIPHLGGKTVYSGSKHLTDLNQWRAQMLADLSEEGGDG